MSPDKRIVFTSARQSASAHLFANRELSGVNKATADFLDEHARSFCNQMDRIERADDVKGELEAFASNIRRKLQKFARTQPTSRMRRALETHVATQHLAIAERMLQQLFGKEGS